MSYNSPFRRYNSVVPGILHDSFSKLVHIFLSKISILLLKKGIKLNVEENNRCTENKEENEAGTGKRELNYFPKKSGQPCLGSLVG